MTKTQRHARFSETVRLIASVSLAFSLSSGLARPSAAAEEPIKLSGFVDVNLRAGKASATPGIQDGALYLEHESDGTQLFLEVPFRLKTGSSDFAVFENETQAYIRHRYPTGGLSWTLGQFDGLFGLERNDTPVIRFSSHGALYGTQPITQLGLLVQKDWSPQLQVSLFAGGAENLGSSELGSRPEVGAKLVWGEDFKVAWGGTFRQSSKTVARAYSNLTLEKTWDKLLTAAQLSLAKAGTAAMAYGVGGFADYRLNDRTQLGVRAELVRKFSDDQQVLLTVGPKHAMTRHLTLKLDYTLDQTRATASALAETTHQGGFSAIYTF